MSVPKGRKKLDRSAAAKKSDTGKPIEKAVQIDPVSNIKTQSVQKLDDAFEIMEQIPHPESVYKQDALPQSQRLGFHWMISLEAVLPGDTSGDSKGSSWNPNRAEILNLGFTIPFFWGWPILDEMTKNFLKYFKPL